MYVQSRGMFYQRTNEVRAHGPAIINQIQELAMKNASAGRLLLVAAVMLGVAACSSTGQGEKTGAYIDDSWITTKVKSALVSDDETKARNIEVKTEKGVVTLTGTAQTWQESYKAADLARAVKGVTSVENEIRIQ